MEGVAGGLARVAAHPGPPVDEHDGWGGPRRPLRSVRVVAHRYAVGGPMDDVGLELVDARPPGNGWYLPRERHDGGLPHPGSCWNLGLPIGTVGPCVP